MSSFFTKRILLIAALLLSLTACGAPIFENSYDVMARQALFDLMKAEESYRSENDKYTLELSQLRNYNLKYHTGIVYLEIQSADKTGYRAVSLPAESSTARVFIYDTSKGGVYEADEVEVAKYVLGALNFIRGEQEKQNTNVLLVTILIGSLVVLGIRFACQHKGRENNSALFSYFISLFPLGWAVAALNHLTRDIVFSSKIMAYSMVAIVFSLISIFITARWMKGKNLMIVSAPVLGIAGATLFISIISAGVVVFTVYKYYPGSF